MWYKEFLNNGEYLKIKLDDEEEDLLDWLDSLVEEEKVGYVSF